MEVSVLVMEHELSWKWTVQKYYNSDFILRQKKKKNVVIMENTQEFILLITFYSYRPLHF